MIELMMARLPEPLVSVEPLWALPVSALQPRLLQGQ
jgi:hypothetical protein